MSHKHHIAYVLTCWVKTKTFTNNKTIKTLHFTIISQTPTMITLGLGYSPHYRR